MPNIITNDYDGSNAYGTTGANSNSGNGGHGGSTSKESDVNKYFDEEKIR